MPTTLFLNAGTEETQDFSLFLAKVQSGTGVATSATDQAHTGTRSMKVVSAATNDIAGATTYDGTCGLTTCQDFWYRVSAIPGGDTMVAMAQLTSDGQGIFGIKLQSTGKFCLYGYTASNGFATAAGSTVLSAATWTRLTLSWSIATTTSYTINLYVDGVLNCTMTGATGTLNSTAVVDVFYGIMGGTLNGQVFSFGTGGGLISAWYDDLYCDNRSDLTDCGDIRVTAKRPIANGTANNFTTQIGAGGSGTGTGHSPQVNELPLSQTNGWSHVVSGSAITEEYTVESVSAGAVDLTGKTIVDWQGWVFAKSLSSETAQIVVNGSTSNISLTSTARAFYKAAGSAVYPPGTGADIGLVTATTATTVSLYECGVSVAFLAPASQNFENPRRPAPFKPMGDAFRTGKYQGWR